MSPGLKYVFERTEVRQIFGPKYGFSRTEVRRTENRRTKVRYARYSPLDEFEPYILYQQPFAVTRIHAVTSAMLPVVFVLM